jgi:hypothetical protein
MGEDPGDYGRFFNGGDDLQGAATIWAAFDIDVEDPLEQARLSLMRACEPHAVSVIGRVRGGFLRWARNDRGTQLGVGREHAVEANQMEPGTRRAPVQLSSPRERLYNHTGGRRHESRYPRLNVVLKLMLRSAV